MSGINSILITGAGGFLGGYTANCFKGAGWQVIGLDRNADLSNHPANPHFDAFIQNDLSDVASILAVLTKHRPSACVHLAGPASVQASIDDPLRDFSNQTLPLYHFLEALRFSETPSRMLLVSSAAVYGNPTRLPINEESKPRPISPYGYHKLHQELMVQQYSNFYHLPVCIARVFSTYGPGLSHLAVWDITHRALHGDFSVRGTAADSRDYLYATDVALALMKIVQSSAFQGEAVNVASGEETSISTLAERILSQLDVDQMPLLLNKEFAGNPVRWQADVSRLSNLGFEKEVSLEAGIRATIDWIKANV